MSNRPPKNNFKSGNRTPGKQAQGKASSAERTPGKQAQGQGKTLQKGQKVRLKNALKHKASSQQWLTRQLNDPYVRQAKAEGYRSRAAYKIIEIEERFKMLAKANTVVDLGAAPGGWTQVAVNILRPDKNAHKCVVALDRLPVDPLPGAVILTGDFEDPDSAVAVRQALGERRADVVLSDLAPNTTGHGRTDHLRIIALTELAYSFAEEILAPGGTFVAKVFQGGSSKDLLDMLKHDFARVVHMKPKASRQESSELYVVALGFRKKPDGEKA